MKLLALLRQVYDAQVDPDRSHPLCTRISCDNAQCRNCPVCPLQSRDDLVPQLESLCETHNPPE